jgi:predicted DCC family thiol-disulfide oxidoreductase YuxK
MHSGSGAPPPPNRYISVATAALLLQVCMVYWFTAILKDHPIWLEGQGILYAMQCDSLVSPIGKMLLAFPTLMMVMTYSTLVIEFLGPLAALSPWKNGPIRFAVVVIFWLLHLGMGLTLVLGHFPFICVAAWCAFLPTWFWDRMNARINDTRRSQNGIFFDGECDLCRRLVAVIRTLLLLDATPAKPAQEAADASILTSMHERKSWVVVDETGKRHFGFDAFVQLCRISPIAWIVAPILALAAVRWFGERIYRLIANDRNRAANWFRWLQFRPLKLDPPGWTSVLLIFLFLYAVAWNIRTTNFDRYAKILPRSWNYIGEISGVDQYWSMFAPYPQTDNGWYVIPAKLVDGSEIDLFTGESVTWDRPASISGMCGRRSSPTTASTGPAPCAGDGTNPTRTASRSTRSKSSTCAKTAPPTPASRRRRK